MHMNRKIVFGQGRVTIRHGAARCSDCAGQGIVKRWADSDVRHDSASVQSRAVQRRLARRARPTPSAANGGRQPEAAAGGPKQNHPQPARVQQGNPLGSTLFVLALHQILVHILAGHHSSILCRRYFLHWSARLDISGGPGQL